MKKFNKSLGLVAMILGLSLILVACGTPKRDLRTKPYVKETFTMGTYVKITAYDKGHEKDIAAALGGFSKREDWFERDDAIVSSAVGHLVELACPEAEDPGFDLARLPAIPSRFNLAPIAKTSARLSLLKKLMNRQDVQQVVNACDAGREGELIFRYIYLCCGCRPAEIPYFQRFRLQICLYSPVGLRVGAVLAIAKSSTYSQRFIVNQGDRSPVQLDSVRHLY